MKTIVILPKLFSLIMILSCSAALGVTELSDGELNQAAAKTNAPVVAFEDSATSTAAINLNRICPGVSFDQPKAQLDMVENDESIESANLRVYSCDLGLYGGAIDPLNDQPPERLYGNLNEELQDNREFIEQNPDSGSLFNSPSFELGSPLPTDRDLQRARDLTLDFGESLRRLRIEP